jgi:hypothetical protein
VLALPDREIAVVLPPVVAVHEIARTTGRAAGPEVEEHQVVGVDVHGLDRGERETREHGDPPARRRRDLARHGPHPEHRKGRRRQQERDAALVTAGAQREQRAHG